MAIFKGDIPWDPQVQKGNIMIANRTVTFKVEISRDPKLLALTQPQYGNMPR